jgi:methylmalonyl-CoA mutase
VAARPARLHALLATRDTGSEISQALPDVIAACKAAGFDLVIVETSGIGQGDAAIVPLVDVPMYVMTPEFGAASQLEKIDMLDFAEFVAINKFDRKGAADALRDVAKQVQRNREAFTTPPEQMPVFGTMASRFNDDGVTALYQALCRAWRAGPGGWPGPPAAGGHAPQHAPDAHRARRARVRYLAEIADTVRGYKAARASRRAGARAAAAARERRACCTRTTARESTTAQEHRAQAGRRARGPARPAPASCWRSGPRCRRPMPATSTW